MNYFAHGHRFLNDPYFLAGTAVPDWLSVADRKVRAHRNRAIQFVNHPQPTVANLARGIVQHHHDDAWFHNTDAFNQITWRTTSLCDGALPKDEGYRPSFLGHILVELLLDAALIAADPLRLERYYAALETVDPAAVELAVNEIAGRSPQRLAWFIDRFRQVRFLCDYADDAKLIFRLNQVMSRVNLLPLPDSFCSTFSAARELVAAHATDCLASKAIPTTAWSANSAPTVASTVAGLFEAGPCLEPRDKNLGTMPRLGVGMLSGQFCSWHLHAAVQSCPRRSAAHIVR